MDRYGSVNKALSGNRYGAVGIRGGVSNILSEPFMRTAIYCRQSAFSDSPKMYKIFYGKKRAFHIISQTQSGHNDDTYCK